MTRNFRDEWEAANSGRSKEEQPADLAPEHVQDEISALLRRSAAEDGPELAMPSDVEARMREAFKAEFGDRASGFDESKRASSGSSTVVPLPARPRRTESAQRTEYDPDATRPASVTPSRPAPARPAAETSARAESERDHSVASLDAHRARKKGGFGKAALALGAAAAVAIGAVGVSKSLGGNDDAQVADGPSPSSSVSSGANDGTQNYASRVRVTQTETQYTSDSLATQAASLPTSTSTPIEPKQADAQSLGPLATGTGVQSCLDAVDVGLAQAPDKVYADFGSYDGQPAVIVVTVKDGKKTAWVVSRTCSKADDLKAGPTPIST
ncbi:hypothetical protein H7F30_03160 [Dermacoccus sp. PAMC28757]|uniref:hypothetical protein n=1 Tax=Dermacoccus sp. PAMC28757 TaxID=2762331 RepID=UPI00164ED71D|nr:hypothetical protein [Dermacoccus sp. PAMC28757]QNK53337.1 hypothetical protein H7F30_03160 [Dermacoccus sp. PAMC28757]